MWQIPNHTPQVIEGVGENAIDIPSGSEPQRQALLAGQVHRPGGLSGWEGFFATMAVDPDTGALN